MFRGEIAAFAGIVDQVVQLERFAAVAAVDLEAVVAEGDLLLRLEADGARTRFQLAADQRHQADAVVGSRPGLGQ